MTPDIQDALKALNAQFGKDLYLAKSDTCMAAFKALKEATTTEQKLSALGKYVREWIDRSAAAIRFWTPKYAAMHDAAGFAGKDKWGWVKENVTKKLQRSCTGPEFAGSWGGPITTWEPLEWWIRNACNEAPTFLILRDEPLILPQWLRRSTKPASDPIGYYRTILTAELGRELEWALDHAKIEAAISSTAPASTPEAKPKCVDSRRAGRPKDVQVEYHKTQILAVLREYPHLEGDKYCEALDGRGIAPPIRWTSGERCPKTYRGAYNHPDREQRIKWRHRIQDEKCRISKSDSSQSRTG